MFQLIKIQLEIFASLQALFPSLKIDIFCRIVPLFLLRIWNESSWKNLYPGKRCFENRHFLTHRSPARPRGILWVDTIGSPHRGILCVEKIGSVAPELQEWPGTPSKPVKSTNGPFYWLTRKRAPPCRGTLWLDPVAGPCRWTPVKTVSRPGSEVGLVLLPGDRFTSFTSHIHTHRKSSYRP